MTKQELMSQHGDLIKEIALEFWIKTENLNQNIGDSRWDKYVESLQPKQEWEIISFYKPQLNFIIKKHNKIKDVFCENYLNDKSTYDLQYLLKADNWNIHSIKFRDEIYTIGDKVNYGKDGIISQFNISNDHDRLYVNIDFDSTSGYSNADISVISKIKSIFTSEDGFDVMEGDTIYTIADICDVIIPVNNLTELYFFKKDLKRFKIFKEKANAEKYIIMNSRVLSIKEICPLIGQASNATYIDLDSLTNLVKEKLKL